MTPTVYTSALLLAFVPGVARAALPTDKVEHFTVSALVATTSYAVARTVLGDSPRSSVVFASAIPLTAGVTWELSSLRSRSLAGAVGTGAANYGTFEWGDLAADALGVATGVALGVLLERVASRVPASVRGVW